MKRIGSSARGEPSSSDAIVIGGETGRPGGDPTRWGVLLSLFMLMIGLLWLARGLANWRAILWPEDAPLDALQAPVAFAIVFFAVADLLAAVGLWLATAWGGVLWLFAAAAGLIATPFLPGFRLIDQVSMALDFALILGYFFLTWRAAQEREF